MTTAPGWRASEDAGVVPRWFARLLVVLLAAVVGFGATGLVLAIVGLCTPIAVGLVGMPVAAGLALLGWPLDATPDSTGRSAWSAAALVLTVGWVVVNAPHAGEHVIVNRDPGVYLVAGRWIADHGTLIVEAGVGPFGTADDVALESAGTYDEGEGRLDLQFGHLVPVLLAEAYWVGGERLLVTVPLLMAAAALLTTYALATRLTGRAWAGLLVASTLATCLPVLAASRDTYSEPMAWLLLTGGLWMWTRAAGQARVPLAALGGLLLGALTMARIDGIVYLLPVPLMVGALVFGRRADGRNQLGPVARAFVIGLVPGVVLSTTDLLLRSREYFRDLSTEIICLWAGLVLSVAIGWIVGTLRTDRLARLSSWTQRRRPALAAGAAGAVVVAGALAFFVRPHVQVARSAQAFEYVGPMQAAEGHPVDPTRRYDERSLIWIAWYVGPSTVLAAIVGGAIVARRSVGQPISSTIVCWLALTGGTVLYLWRPSITPDQIWASRRFVPAALPLVVTLAAVVAVAVVDAVRRRVSNGQVIAAALATALFVGLVTPASAASRSVASLSDQHGYLDLAHDLCAQVNGGAVLAVDGERAGITLPQTLRSFCGVPVGLLTAADATPERAAALAGAWAIEGRDLHVVAATTELVSSLVPGATVTRLGPYETDRALEVTVTRLPRRLVEVSDTIYVGTIRGRNG